MNKRLRYSSSLYSALLSLHQLRTLFSKMWHRVMCFAAWIGLRMSVKQSQGLHMTFAQCWAHWLTFRQMYSEWKSTPRCWHLANVEYDRKDERHYNHCFLQASIAKGISSCHWINGTLCFLSHTSIHLFIFFSCRDRDIQSFKVELNPTNVTFLMSHRTVYKPYPFWGWVPLIMVIWFINESLCYNKVLKCLQLFIMACLTIPLQFSVDDPEQKQAKNWSSRPQSPLHFPDRMEIAILHERVPTLAKARPSPNVPIIKIKFSLMQLFY